MTPSFMQTAQMPHMPFSKAPYRPPAPSFRLARVLFAPAILAIALVAAACSSSPSPSSSANSLISQGLSAESSGQTQQALKDFNAAVAKDPSTAIGYYDLGVLYQQQLNQPTLAATEYNKALLANPSYKPALFNLAILETSTDPTSAIATYNKLLALNPNDPNVNFNLGLLLIAQNQPLQGHTALKKAIALDPSLAKRVPKGITP
jgi:tetratricopeptide (TPR) repeat protein